MSLCIWLSLLHKATFSHWELRGFLTPFFTCIFSVTLHPKGSLDYNPPNRQNKCFLAIKKSFYHQCHPCLYFRTSANKCFQEKRGLCGFLWAMCWPWRKAHLKRHISALLLPQLWSRLTERRLAVAWQRVGRSKSGPAMHLQVTYRSDQQQWLWCNMALKQNRKHTDLKTSFPGCKHCFLADTREGNALRVRNKRQPPQCNSDGIADNIMNHVKGTVCNMWLQLGFLYW